MSPLVSICCTTYNHKKFIAQCLDGFIMQQTNFAFEILVHEDASPDGTADIVRAYEAKYPHLFRCVYQTENQFKKQNTLVNILFPMSKGKYIALCEGDDYWTDPSKLQKQADFLESNYDFGSCFHAVKIVDSNDNLVSNSKNSFVHNRDLSSDELIGGRVMSVSSLFFRNVIKEFPEEFHMSPTGDNFLCSLLGNYGKGKYLIDVKASAYRMHSGGTWSLKDDSQKKMVLLRSYFLLWQYYNRIGKPKYALGFYKKIILEGFYSNPFKEMGPKYLGNVEVFIVRTVRKVFRVLRWLLLKIMGVGKIKE